MSDKKKTRIDEQALETWMLTKFYRGLITAMESDQKTRVPGIHVTDIVMPCLRRGYFSHKYREQHRLDASSCIRIWIGEKLHETPLCEVHELPLKHPCGDLSCKVDEYDPKTGFFMDKKSTRGDGKYLTRAKEHEVTQAEYYRVMLERNGYAVNGAGILHINVDTTERFPCPVNIFQRSLEEIDGEMLGRKEALQYYIKTDTKPPRCLIPRWQCSYCDWFYECWLEE